MEEISKQKSTSKNKEKCQFYSQPEGQQRKNVKHQGLSKGDISQLIPPQPLGNNLSTKKALHEVDKIVTIGLEKEFDLLEKNKALQNLTDTIDNLRKNIIHLQMEYEKLDQNYQKEISYRSEVIKRIDTTRGMVDSSLQYSNALCASIKQLEDDKLKIANFYKLIYQSQTEVEEKHSKVGKFIKEIDSLMKLKIEEFKKFQEKISTQNSEIVTQLNKKLSFVNDKLKVATTENQQLHLKIDGFKRNINNLEMSLREEQRLCNEQQNESEKYKFQLKNLKSQKCKYQKMYRNKRKKILTLKNKNKILMKNYLDIDMKYKESLISIKSLESEREEWKTEFTKQLEINKKDHLIWASEKEKLLNSETEKDVKLKEIITINENLQKKILEMSKNEEIIQNLQNDSLMFIDENKKLKESVIKLNNEKDAKEKMVTELEQKMKELENIYKTDVDFYKKEAEKYQKLVNELEGQLLNEQNKFSKERTEKENIKTELNKKLEIQIKSTSDKITRLEKSLKEKEEKIKQLNSELQDKMFSFETLENEIKNLKSDGKQNLGKLENEFRLEKNKNEELNVTICNLKKNNEILNYELGRAKNQISDFEEKLTEEKTLINSLQTSKNELNKKTTDLTKEVEQEKKSCELLKQKLKKAENELLKLQKISEENSALKLKISGIKKNLDESETKLEAYKVAVKKLESEKAQAENFQCEEISKLKSEVKRMEGLLENNKEKLPINTKDSLIKEQRTDSEAQKFQQGLLTPNQSNKKFFSTPRKVFTSTPQSGFNNLTPIAKSNDPYKFDSDSSTERFDPDQVLKVFNKRQKKETGKKKPKTLK